MGIRMEDLHTPTVASGSTASGTSDGAPKEQVPLIELVAAKERVESELSALSSVLDSHGVNMNTSLTTFDGYPRDDIDVAQIRTTRARIIHLRNDYKDLLARIEAGLHAHHASATAQAPPTTRPIGASAGTSGLEAPFAKVNSVVPGSPAEAAGLQVGDRILRFGTANWMNHDKLAKVAEIVARSEGNSLPVKISRDSSSGQQPEKIQLQLTPRRDWGGRGMLGCHLLPL